MPAKNVVVIGGGGGTHLTLQGLKRYNVRLTALISTFDTRYHWQAGPGTDPSPPPDDVRRNLLALGADSNTSQILERLFAYQVPALGAGGLNFGGLFLNALIDIMGTTDLALQAAAQVLNVQGQVLPLTMHGCPLIVATADGRETAVHTPAELRAVAAQGGVQTVRIAQPVPVLETVRQALARADIIILGAAHLHFNVVAPLEIDELRAAITASRAIKIFVCNILTEPHTTAGWPASRFLRRVLAYLGGPDQLDYAIINSTLPTPQALEREAALGYAPVALDLDECMALGPNIIVRPVADAETLYHDPERLARTILFLGSERGQHRSGEPSGNAAPFPMPAPPAALAPSGVEA